MKNSENLIVGNVSYDKFLNDVATHVVNALKAEEIIPEYISQRTAFKLFGRKNVLKWRFAGKILPHKFPGKLEYNLSELNFLKQLEHETPNNTH